MAQNKVFTRSEVKNSQDKDKNIFILHDKVYDVHSFLNEHPGGEEILTDHKGQDASEDFDDVGHSKDAMELMKKYQIGMLVESERSNASPKKGWVAGYNKASETHVQGPGVPFYLLIGGIAIVAALFLYAY